MSQDTKNTAQAAKEKDNLLNKLGSKHLMGWICIVISITGCIPLVLSINKTIMNARALNTKELMDVIFTSAIDGGAIVLLYMLGIRLINNRDLDL